MAVAFSRTTRALESDDDRLARIGLSCGVALVLAWAAWLGLGQVTVLASSRRAHVEVVGAARALSVEQAGRLVASGLFAGRQVHAGEVLAELDSTFQRARLAEALARLASYPERIAALRTEIASSRSALAGTAQAGDAAVAAARARAEGSEAGAAFERDLAARQQADVAGGASAPIDAARSAAEARRAGSEGQARRHELAGATQQARIGRAERMAALARAEADLAQAESGKLATEALVGELQAELVARRIVAPADGVIGEVAALRIGEVVNAGTRLATLVPSGALHVVAQFDAATGFGRLAAGQSARMRLDGFAWAQYGDFPARVERVAAEPRDDMVRVDLLLLGNEANVPLRHGMTGAVDVALEETSPALLLLRAVGRWLA